MEYGGSPEWNGMEDLKKGMENRLPYFHTNYIHSLYQNLLQITKYYQTSSSDNESFRHVVTVLFFCVKYQYNVYVNAGAYLGGHCAIPPLFDSAL